MPDILQDKYAPNSVCFGCGPKNLHGLQLKSVADGDAVVAVWKPRREHVAFGNFGSGGIISVLMDCQGNWAASVALMKARGLPTPPGTVTVEYTVRFVKPSPINETWQLRAWAARRSGDRVDAIGDLKVGGVVTASMSGLFVAVKESHPAFHRWH